MQDAYIVSSVRTPVGRAFKGTLRATRPDDLAALVLKEALRRAPGVEPSEIEDVILGCAMPEAEQGMNVARVASLRAELPVSASAMTINRFCSSGLEAIALGTEKVRSGARAVLSGGVESMSMVPMGGHKPSANPWLFEHMPEAYLSMGLTAERLAEKYRISREEADQFSLRSHQRALAAIESCKFSDETVSVETRVPVEVNGHPSASGASTGNSRKPQFWQPAVLKTDEGPRRDTSLNALAGLKPAFHARGTVTAGNSSQMSDGAAAVLLLSDDAVKEHGLKPLGRLVAYATGGVDPAIMGIGPVEAIPKALKRAGLTLNDIEVIELNEAFAAQSLAVIKEVGLDPERVNVNGGAIALGHPLGCTGSKLVATILRELQRRHARYGLVTMCVGGGMGAAGIIENLRV